MVCGTTGMTQKVAVLPRRNMNRRPTTDYLLQTKPLVIQQTSNDRLNTNEILLPLSQVLGIFGSLNGLLVLRLDSGL